MDGRARFIGQLAGVFGGTYALTSLVLGGASRYAGVPPERVPLHPHTAAALEELRAAASPASPVVLKQASIENPLPARPAELPKLVAVDWRIAQTAELLRPAVKRRLLQAAERLPKGVTLVLTSAYRTFEEQEALHPTFGVKAKPGTSTHEDGRGIDLNTLVDGERISPRAQHEVIGPALSENGFRALGAIDPVHYSIPAGDLEGDLGEDPILNLASLEDVAPAGAAEPGYLER